MKVTIVGIQDKSYVDKKTGELKEMLQISFTRPLTEQGSCGCSVGYENVSAKSFPEQYKLLKTSFDKLLGKTAIISKDVRTFNGNSYAVLDELEVLT